MVCFKNVSIKTKDNKVIINDFSINIKKSELCLILGKNGTGKSTFLKTIVGLYKNFSGDITVNTQKISYLPQSLNIDRNFPIKVYDLLEMGLYKKYGILKSIQNTDIIFDIAKTTGISNVLDQKINQISGGQLQTAFFAKILIENSDLIVLDEPFANIDQKSIENLIDILIKLNKTIIIITHDSIEKVKKHANQIINL